MTSQEDRTSPGPETRQERRARKLRKRRERMPQHGKGLAQVYKQAIEKREKGK